MSVFEVEKRRIGGVICLFVWSFLLRLCFPCEVLVLDSLPLIFASFSNGGNLAAVQISHRSRQKQSFTLNYVQEIPHEVLMLSSLLQGIETEQ